MTKIRLPKSIKKYLRKEKARLRREIFSLEEQKLKINELLKKFYGKKRPEKISSSIE